jgi:hypothetical protein
MILRDHRSGKILLKNVSLAASFSKRFAGYMLKPRPKNRTGILFRFKRDAQHPIHTFFMRFAVDLVFLDKNMKIVEVRENVPPWRFYRSKKKFRYLLEVPSGLVRDLGLKAGRRLRIE